jgi:hypothetical protein
VLLWSAESGFSTLNCDIETILRRKYIFSQDSNLMTINCVATGLLIEDLEKANSSNQFMKIGTLGMSRASNG